MSEKKVNISYCPCDTPTILQPTPDPCQYMPRQSYASYECSKQDVTINFTGTSLVLTFDIIESMYKDMSKKRKSGK